MCARLNVNMVVTIVEMECLWRCFAAEAMAMEPSLIRHALPLYRKGGAKVLVYL